MKIAHIYAQNLKIFEDSLAGTGYKINGSVNIDYLIQSLSNFNVRDVLGLVVYKQNMTKKALKLIHAFDDLFVFSPLPIIVISDNATQLYRDGKLTVRHSPLFLIDSVAGTISDVDLKSVFVTLGCMSDTMYDLRGVDAMHQPVPVIKG